tara:strand:- start:19115 stop:19357 length:243 start_codon:yes stop_codon:yes gene_type:complete
MIATTTKEKITAGCRMCSKTETFEVCSDNLIAWQQREMLAQDAFPELPVATVELMISGTCGTCWKEMFGPMDDEELEDEE